MAEADARLEAAVDWSEVARLVSVSRALDHLEETRLVPEKKVLYQFSARGHDMAQVILGLHLADGDAACGYYRSRPMLLALGVPLADALGSGMGRAGGYSDGRDIGVVFNYPNPGGAHALPMCGGVGAQYTPAAGWAQAVLYKERMLGEQQRGAIGVVLGGDASCATGGFWAALTIATTQSLPMLFYIEDNGYGISVPSEYQTPGSDIAANLFSFGNLSIWNGDGTDPAEAGRLIGEAVNHVRSRKGPALIRLAVPRLEGHSFQDTQTYKSDETVKAEWARDPLPKLKAFADHLDWDLIEASAAQDVEAARAEAEARGVSLPEDVAKHVFFDGTASKVGGGAGLSLDGTSDVAAPEGQRINMVTAIRRVLDQELEANPKMLVFGEDVGPKGGVHAVTLRLQDKYARERRIEHPVVAVLVLQPQCDRMDPALGPDILAEHQHLRIRRQFLVKHAADRGDHVDPLALGRGQIGRAIEAQPRATTDLGRLTFEKDIARDPLGRRRRARLGLDPRRLDLVRNTRLDPAPVEVRRISPQLGQRIARPFVLDLGLRLVGLRVLETMPLEPRHGQPDQRRPFSPPHVPDRLADQHRRLRRFGAVAVEDGEVAERCEVGGNVASRGLVIRWHRDAVAIVLDVK